MVLRDVLQQPFAQALAAALEHFLWQGAVLGLALAAAIRLLRPGARLRYVMGVATLAAMALAPVATLAVVSADRPSGVATAFTASLQAAAQTGAVTGTAAEPASSRWTGPGIVVAAWVIGVLAFSLRLLGGWVMTRQLVARTRDRASAEIRWLADRLSRELALGRHVEIFESPAIVVPMLIGWIAPVIILPTAALAGLAPAQLEALIAHELAHVRRHDYLVNLLQSVVETLLFFHPAVWWVSRDVRESREHCCDDLVIGLCDRVVYASALADLAALVRGPRLALAATDGSLVNRVRRILGGRDDGRRGRQEWMAAAVLTLLVIGAVPIAFASARQAAVPAPAPQPVATGLQGPAVVLRPATSAPVVIVDNPKLDSSATRRTTDASGDARVNFVAAPAVSPAPQGDVQAIELKLQRELEELNAQPALAQDRQDRQAELKAAIQRLHDLLGDRALSEKQMQDRKVDLEELQAKLAALDRMIVEGQRAVDRLPDQMAEAKAKLERAKVLRLDDSDLRKLKEDRAREVDDTLQQLKFARALGADDEAIAKMKTEAGRKDDTLAFKLATAMGRDATDLDPKEIQSVIAPAFDAGPNDVSVVGRVVRHPGRVEWREGLTVEAALKAAGAPPISNTDSVVRRLSALQVTFGAGGPHASGRVDEVNADTILRPGDVIVVSPRVKK